MRWHRRIGIMTSLFVVIISITGIALNHAVFFNLEGNKINSRWILKLYNLTPETTLISYNLNPDWVSQLDESIYINGNLIGEFNKIIGVTYNSDSTLIIVATKNSLILLTPSGEILEEINKSLLPPGEITSLGLHRNKVILLTKNGFYEYDDNFIAFSHTDIKQLNLVKQARTPSHINKLIEKSYQEQGITLHRFILDLHSGKIFGKMGPVASDLIALGLIYLVFSGLRKWIIDIKMSKIHTNKKD